jgi:hypothetical protein
MSELSPVMRIADINSPTTTPLLRIGFRLHRFAAARLHGRARLGALTPCTFVFD